MRRRPFSTLCARHAPARRTALALLLGAAIATLSRGADLAEVRAKLRTGDYESAAALADEGRKAEPREAAWWRLQAEALMAVGNYGDALDLLEGGLRTALRESVRLRLLAFEAARFAGRSSEAERLRQELRYLLMRNTRYVRDIAEIVDLGEAALLLGAEPRLVLENFLNRGRDSRPPVRDAFLAIGRLALAKHDYALASRTYQQGISAFEDDPDMWAGLAASFINGDRTKLVEYASHALELNERHTGARLLLAENQIDSEDYDAADTEIERILAVNPHAPEAHALRSVLAHLRNDPAAAEAAREAALATWPNNPAVDTLIGRKLAQRGFHAQSIPVLRRALDFDPRYTPARIQLAQSLLRSGHEEEGWALAAAVHEDDGYDITAYNLTNLHDRLQEFETLRTPHFELRMGPAEAAIYGRRALDLLERARAELTARYGVTLERPTAVEIFPNPKDFSVRTFGMPGGPPEFLGVCFGPLITVNSPASKHTNWEATLWHEFMHTVTDALTRSRVPKWLTEGISVYEQTRANPAWAIPMSVNFHQRITEGRMQPISRMSAAFLEVKTLEDHVFAYYQSYLVVQFLAETYGFERLRAMLAALGEGASINDALAQHIAPLEELDAAFETFARAEADRVAAGYDLRPPDDRFGGTLAAANRRSVFGQLEKAREMLQTGRALEARFILKRMAGDGIYLPGPGNIHHLLAEVCRELGDTEGERAALTTIVEHEGDALDAVTRLLELAQQANDPAATARWADHWISINPIAPTPWRALFAANEARDDAAAAVEAGKTLLRLDPPDRVVIHHRIGRLLKASDPAEARHHVLLALEEAPRFRAAHELLADLPPGPGVAAELTTPTGHQTSPSPTPAPNAMPEPETPATTTPTNATSNPTPPTP